MSGGHGHGHEGPEELAKKIGGLVSDHMREKYLEHHGPGHPITGEALIAGPEEMRMILDYTTLRGGGSNIYYSLIYQLPKWQYKVVKVDESIEVTPTWRDFYELTIAQKNRIEASIKQGLASAAQAVADYELIQHDLRRYQEILDYFKQSHKEKDEHVLRSLFVDRVDAHTGEPYSMISMTKRWPTIITDFIRMGSDMMDRGVIRDKLDVSDAEATVLLTKNKLYHEWKTLFLPTIKERVARLRVLVDSRKKSVDEYRNWLKPYVARYKMIKETLESDPKGSLHDAYMTPGFGQSQALTSVKLWVWKPFPPPEKLKSDAEMEEHHFGFRVNPYDHIVKEWKAVIEKKYGVEITDKDVKSILDKSTDIKKGGWGFNPAMEKNSLYYIFFEINCVLSLTRTPPPEGGETDNMMFWPVRTWILSQNLLLVHLLELHARDKQFEKNINMLIGSKEAEEAEIKRIEEEFTPHEEEKPNLAQSIIDPFSRTKATVKPKLEWFFYLFVKKGPYEPMFKERVTKIFSRQSAQYYDQITKFLMKKMQVE